MRKLVVLTFVSLDGVMQAPGGPDEDRSGGFEYGGWTFPYFDDKSGEIMDQQMSMPFDLLLGKVTYDIFASYWPQQAADNSISQVFNKATKYVVAHEQFDAPWDKSVVITGANVEEQIRHLKAEDGPMLQVHGSADLIQTLLEHDLVDELWLKTYPVTLGQGKRLFAEGTRPAAFKLIDSTVTDSGVIFANYVRDGDVKTGSFVE
jgi:dihydrofolate reductase